MASLTPEQVRVLLRPIKPARVMHANGQSHLPAYDVAAHLTRILGYGGWSTEQCQASLAFEDVEERTKGNPPKPYKVWTVGYTATLRLVIKDPEGNEVAHYENGAAGDAVNQPSRGDAHHLAMTTAISTALKRCAAFALGDQFGLSLYNKGATGALVGTTLVVGGQVHDEGDVQASSPKPESLGNDERQPGASVDADGDAGATQTGTQTGGGERPMSNDITQGQQAIKAHPVYKMMDTAVKGQFLSDTVGFEVSSIRQLSDDDCEQVLAALRAREESR